MIYSEAMALFANTPKYTTYALSINGEIAFKKDDYDLNMVRDNIDYAVCKYGNEITLRVRVGNKITTKELVK